MNAERIAAWAVWSAVVAFGLVAIILPEPQPRRDPYLFVSPAPKAVKVIAPRGTRGSMLNCGEDVSEVQTAPYVTYNAVFEGADCDERTYS